MLLHTEAPAARALIKSRTLLHYRICRTMIVLHTCNAVVMTLLAVALPQDDHKTRHPLAIASYLSEEKQYTHATHTHMDIGRGMDATHAQAASRTCHVHENARV